MIAVVSIGAYLLSAIRVPGQQEIGQPVSSAFYQSLYILAKSTYGTANHTLMSKFVSFSGQPFASGSKPILVYVGADFCPYCAFQRWPLVIALMRFGNFSNLAYMLSSSTDAFPNSPTFTFHGSAYSSSYLVFQSYEQEDRSQRAQDTVPSNYSAVFQQYGASYPFLDFGNRYIVQGSFYFPDKLDGKNWTQIAQLLTTDNPVSNQIIGSANAITAAICKLTGNAPPVCQNGIISGLTTVLAAYHQSGSASLKAGTPISNPATWAKVQYGQTEWITKSSTEARYPTETTPSSHSGINARSSPGLSRARIASMIANQPAPSKPTGTPPNLLNVLDVTFPQFTIPTAGQ
ncbi:MAG: DUF929 family protein [Nitrososphaerales archaeon]|nr:DUF929 family protein [Nitrososphaerales archaeon]